MQPALRVYADDICATSRVCLDAQGSTRVGAPAAAALLSGRPAAGAAGIAAYAAGWQVALMAIAALCAVADGDSELTGIAHLRGHETDRLIRRPDHECQSARGE